MADEGGSGRPRRVVVAFSAGEQDAATLERAAQLAAELRAELAVLFLEDPDVVVAAGLPMTRLISGRPGGEGEFEPQFMRRALRVWSVQAQRAVEATATRWRVGWSFSVAHGPLAERLAAELREQDLLAVAAGAALRGASPLRRALRAALAEAACSALLLHGGVRPGRATLALFEGAGETLEMAARLARMSRGPLVVVALGDDEAAAAARAQEARRWLDAHQFRARIHSARADAGEAIRRLVQAEAPGLLVARRRGLLDEELAAILEALGASALVLRGG